MSVLLPFPKFKPLDHLGQIIPGGFVFTFVAGTSSPKDTWMDQAKAVVNSNPVELDGYGEANIWIDGAYKIIVTDEEGDVDSPIYSVDNIIGYNPLDWTGLTATIPMLNATDTRTLLKTADYQIVLSDRGKTILVDASSGPVTITAIQAAPSINGFLMRIKKIDSSNNAVTIAAPNSETFDGHVTLTVRIDNDLYELLCDGTNFKVVTSIQRDTGIIKSINSNYTVTIDDDGSLIKCIVGTADYTVTLPSAVTVGKGFDVSFKKDPFFNIVTLQPAAGQKIDSHDNFGMNGGNQYLNIVSDGANWIIQGSYGFDLSTGDVKATFKSLPDPGWVLMNDGTIGKTGSGATTRANDDCLFLFQQLYVNIPDSVCPVSGGRTGDNFADFQAGKLMTIPKSLGMAMCSAGAGSGLTVRALGTHTGTETHILSTAELATHHHDIPLSLNSGVGIPLFRDGDELNPSPVHDYSTGDTGSSTPFSIMQPSFFVNFMMRL